MKDSSVHLLLSEYDRLKGIEVHRFENYERSLQLYLTVITVAMGFVLLVLEGKVADISQNFSISLAIAFVLFVGEINFLRAVSTDIGLMEIKEAYNLIRKEFTVADPNLKNAFLSGVTQDVNRQRSWLSIKGIIIRSLTVSQQKTVIVLINSIFASSLSIIFFAPTTIPLAIIEFLAIFMIVGILHAIYASWRYRVSAALLSSGEISHWI